MKPKKDPYLAEAAVPPELMYAPSTPSSRKPEQIQAKGQLTSTTDAEPGKDDVKAARPSLEAAIPEGSEAPTPAGEMDLEEEEDESPEYRRLYARMEAKIRRMCTPSNVSGRTTASPDLIRDWKEKGYKRVQLAEFQQKVESWRKTEMFRKKVQKVKEFCEKHGFVRKNQYDEDETEYWVDFRTEGSRGTNETDGLLESRSADVTGADGLMSSGLDEAPMPELPMGGAHAPGMRNEKEQDSSNTLIERFI
ncbi:unnamed protein product [Symbiodinium sp. CCMP2592]|nr:unnamed protein product [Symbiodinium sp. CCMP2592]